MNKKVLIIIGFLVVSFGAAYIQFQGVSTQKKETIKLTILVKQSIIDGESTSKSNSRIALGSTALHLLSSTHTIVTKGQNENAFVTSIDNRMADSTKNEFWAFYVNGKQASVGAGSYKVRNNDTIEWKIETY